MRILAGMLVLMVTATAVQGGAGRLDTPVDLLGEKRRTWELSAETLQSVGVDNSRNNYLMTQFISFGIEPFRPWALGPLKLRTQLINSLVVSAIVEGPDNYYVGWAPEVRFIVPLGASRWSWQAAFAAGLGAADANQNRPDDGGLGQTFTFLLSAKSSLRYAVSDAWSVWLGAGWLHLSNGGQSEPKKQNIGADSFGPVLGVAWAF